MYSKPTFNYKSILIPALTIFGMPLIAATNGPGARNTPKFDVAELGSVIQRALERFQEPGMAVGVI